MVKSRELVIGLPVDSQSQKWIVGCPAQGMGCGGLWKQGGAKGESRRAPAEYRRIDKGIRRYRAKG